VGYDPFRYIFANGGDEGGIGMFAKAGRPGLGAPLLRAEGGWTYRPDGGGLSSFAPKIIVSCPSVLDIGDTSDNA
jgi:hypothetical protein